MHIGFLTSLVPDRRPQSGFEIANRAVIDALRDLGHRVSVVGAALPHTRTDEHEDTHVLARMEVENVRSGTAQKLRWLAVAVRRTLPFSAAKMVPVVGKAKRQLDRLDPDLLVVNSYHLAMPILLQRPFVYLAHNVESQTARENARRGSALERQLYRRDARILTRLEETLIGKAAHVWTLTAEDRDGFGLNRAACDVIPLVVARVSREGTVAKAFDIVMIGTWTWTANRAGLRWFLGDVLPHLPNDFRVAIAGSVPDEVHSAHRNVNFLGRVDDAQAFLDQGYVVPLVARGGTGVQLKTIEAFGQGRATVATTSSLRGIAEPPANCRVEDQPEAFAAALVDLVSRARSGETIETDGRAFYETQRDALQSSLRHGLDALDRGR